MNSRERVAAAIARQPVDRVPLGFYAVDHDTVSKVIGRPTYVRNKIAQWLAMREGRRTEVAESLKKDSEMFGHKMAFWGGVPVELLLTGSPAEVRQAVRISMERGAPGGGFILGPSHSVAMNTKYDNFMAMLDEFVKLRGR